MKRLIVRIALTTLPAFALACTAQPPPLPSRDFDRPTDIAFVCMGAFSPATSATEPSDAGTAAEDAATSGDGDAAGGLVVSGQPMRWCHPRTAFDPLPDDTHHTFAFVPNSSMGTLSVVNADTWTLVDLDLANAGYSTAPLGVLPTQITASDDGCRLVTANQGSCDLSLVDPSALLTPTLARTTTGLSPTMPGAPTSTITPFTADGTKLRVAPGEIAVLPRPTSTLTQTPNPLCAADWSGQAVVTFPSCGLVALLELPSGRIIDSAYVTNANGVVTTVPAGTSPVCAMRDCRDDGTSVAVPVAATDAGTDGTVADASGDADDGSTSADAEAGTDGGADTSDGAADADAGTDGGADTSDGASDAEEASSDAGAATLGHPNPIALNPIATAPGTFRTYVGLSDAPAILRFDVTSAGLGPVAAGPINLTPDALGTNRLRLSIDPYGDNAAAGTSAVAGTFVGDKSSPAVQDRKYLYAIARDGTVRVVWVATTTETECETSIDPLNLPAGQALSDACIPVTTTTPANRRPTALGPGLRLPTPAIDIAVADIRPQKTPDHSETSVTGAYTYIATASGAVYMANIDPLPRYINWVNDLSDAEAASMNMKAVLSCTTPADPTQCHAEDADPLSTPPPNTLRDADFLGYSLALDSSGGPPRVEVLPTVSTIGPRIELVWTRGSANNATALTNNYIQTPVFFPDRTAVRPQSWSITWEGNLLGTPRFSGQFVTDSADNTTLQDSGGNFCDLGLQTNDLMTIHGCVDATECGVGKVCVPGTAGQEAAGGLPIYGLCLSPTTPEKTCDSLLSTVRRYDITTARPGSLSLAPHKDELVRPAMLDPCTVQPTQTNVDGGADADGDTDADGDASPADAGAGDAGKGDGATDGGASTPGECMNPDDPSTEGFQCFPVDGQNRCLQACSTAGSPEGCRAGRICVSFGLKPDECNTNECFCADGPPLSGTVVKDCLGELTAYNVGIGRGFLVAGSASGIPQTETNAPDPNDPTQQVCVPIPNLDPRIVVRIPMDAPTCTTGLPDTVDPATLDSRCDPDLQTPDCASKDVSTTASSNLINLEKAKSASNPCVFTGGPNDSDLEGAPTPATKPPTHTDALFRNDEIQFIMTNLEQPLSGTYQIRFDVHGGFRAQVVTQPSTVELTLPARLVLGPVDSVVPQSGAYDSEVPYLFVVDQRRLGRSQGGGPTRGQLLRINPRGLVITTPVTGEQPWFEDLAHSSNLFPIQ